MPGIRVRKSFRISRYRSPFEGRNIARSISGCACCSGMSMYLQTLGSRAMASISSSSTVAGYRYSNRIHARSSISCNSSSSCARPPRRAPRSRPNIDVSCAIKINSRVPAATSARASLRIDSLLRERKRPRNCGMMQNVHGWSQPSATLRYAVARGVVISRGRKSCSGSASKPRRTGPRPARASSSTSTIDAYAPVPTTPSISGTSERSSSPKRCERQPATISC